MSLLLLFSAAVPDALGVVATTSTVTGTLTARPLSTVTTSGTSGYEVTASCSSSVTTGATVRGVLATAATGSVVVAGTANGVPIEAARATTSVTGAAAGVAGASPSAVTLTTGSVAGVMHAASVASAIVTASTRGTLVLPASATVSSGGPVQGMATTTATAAVASAASVSGAVLAARSTATITTAGVAIAEGQELVQGAATAVGSARGVSSAAAVGAASVTAPVVGVTTASTQMLGGATGTARATLGSAMVGQVVTTGTAMGTSALAVLGAVSSAGAAVGGTGAAILGQTVGAGVGAATVGAPAQSTAVAAGLTTETAETARAAAIGTGTARGVLEADARAIGTVTAIVRPADVVEVRAAVATAGSATAALVTEAVGRSVSRSHAHRIGPAPRIVVATEHPRDAGGSIVLTPLEIVTSELDGTVRYRMALTVIGSTAAERDAWGMAAVRALVAGGDDPAWWSTVEIEAIRYGVSSEAYAEARYGLVIECAVMWMADAVGPDHARMVLARLVAQLGTRVVVDGTRSIAESVWARCVDAMHAATLAPVYLEPARPVSRTPAVTIRPIEQRRMPWGLEMAGWAWTLEVDVVVPGEGASAEDDALGRAATIATALADVVLDGEPIVDVRVFEARNVRSETTEAGPVTAVTLTAEVIYQTTDTSPYRLAA